MNCSIGMNRWGIDCVEFHIFLSLANNIMLGICWHIHNAMLLNFCCFSIYNSFTFTFYNKKNLVARFMCFFTNFFTWQKVHQNKLTMYSCKDDMPEICIFL